MSDWQPPEHVRQIVAPALAGRRRLYDLGSHQCLVEYETATGQRLRRQLVMLDARNATYSILIRAHFVGQPKSSAIEYRVHRMLSITGPDGTPHDPATYLRRAFGLVIE